MKNLDRHQLVPTPVRIPEDVKLELKTAAEANDRSLNGEILARLRASIKSARKRKALDKGGSTTPS